MGAAAISFYAMSGAGATKLAMNSSMKSTLFGAAALNMTNNGSNTQYL